MLSDFYQMHSQFLNFMIKKGYSVRARESLISPIFPTTFTMSGGPDLAYKFWQGDKGITGNQIVNQPCIRHWDIDLTGDKKHLSFFNMFVANSIGGYSRKEVMLHFFEFFTKDLNLDPKRFHASYFAGGNIKGTNFEPDNEMKDIWESIGIDSNRIIPFSGNNAMETFVANKIEPVGGPRSELFYDLRENPQPIGSPEEFLNLEKEGKTLEFFTHVLYDVKIKVEGEAFYFEKMSSQAIAAGFGPQRILRIVECTGDIGDISIFDSLKKCLENSPKNFHRESVITADHVRGLVFLINDGVLDLHGRKNNSRKYVFRKYLNHFKENFEKLPIKNKECALKCFVSNSVELFGKLFPEFTQNKELISEKFIEAYGRY